MRIVAWNANLNKHFGKPEWHRHTIEQDVELLEHLHADIIVLSETAPPSEENPLGAKWIGSRPGLAIVARKGLTLEAHSANNNAPTLMGGFYVRGELEFNLLAVWPVQRDGDPTYHQTLMTGLDRFSNLLNCSSAIMAGDFNSSTKVIKQKSTHPKFVKAAKDLGLVSAYHFQSGEVHGKETINTYRHNDNKAFHIDYVFMSRHLATTSTIDILRTDYWATLSDHFPLVLDVPNDALTKPL